MNENLATIMAENEDKALLDGINLLLKLLGNIVAKPTEMKFRNIKKTNPRIASAIFSLKGGMEELLMNMGFRQDGEELLVFEGNAFATLNRGIKLTEEAVDPVKCKFMSPDELKKYELIKANARAYAEKQAADRAKIEQAKKMQDYDRQEKATEEIKDSVGNKLTYGANIHKFEPPVRRG